VINRGFPDGMQFYTFHPNPGRKFDGPEGIWTNRGHERTYTSSLSILDSFVQFRYIFGQALEAEI
jgi:hypothetical protein